MVNPFYIQPGNNYGPGLRGLADSIGKVTDRKREEEAAQAQIAKEEAAAQAQRDQETVEQKEIQEAMATNDPVKIKAVMAKYPKKAAGLKAAIETKFPGETKNTYMNALFSAGSNVSTAPQVAEELKKVFMADGIIDQEEAAKIDKVVASTPEELKKFVDSELALITSATGNEKLWEQYQDLQGGGGTDKYEGLTPGYEEYLRVNNLENTPENYAKYKFKEQQNQEFSPSPLKKLINERQEYIDKGMDETDPIIKAYDSKITGADIDVAKMTEEEIDTWGTYLALTGKMPSVGRGKNATKIKAKIVKSAARYALGANEDGIPDEPDKTPVEAALSLLGEQSDTKSIQGSLNFLDKQLSSMGSFVTNLNSQVDKVSELSKDLKSFDTRLLNIPLRSLRGRIKGSPLQAKYDMYLTEIESEIGKLSSGSSASVAELSEGAREKWAKIHDKNLSVSDMLELLDETKEAANFRQQSVQLELDKSRARMRRKGIIPEDTKPSADKTDEELMKSLGL